VACAVVALLSSLRASAQLAQAAYADVKDVIEELLTREVAESATPRLACLAGRLPATESCENDDGADCRDQTVVKLADGHYSLIALQHLPLTLDRLYSRRFGSLRATLLDESADLVAYAVYSALPPAPFTASGPTDPDLVSQIAAPDNAASEGAALGASFQPLSDKDLETCTRAVGTRFKTGRFRSKGPPPLEKKCVTPARGDEYRCELAFAVRFAFLQDSDSAADHLIRAAGTVVSEVLTSQLNANAVIIDAANRTAFRERVTLALRDLVVGPSGAARNIADHLAQDIATLVTKSTSGNEVDAKRAELSQQLSAFLPTLQRIRTEWRFATGNGRMDLDVATFLETVARTGGSLAVLCQGASAAKTQGCEALDKVAKFLEGESAEALQLLPIIRAARRGNMSEVTHLAARALFEHTQNEKAEASVYRRFIESLAAYLIDSTTEGMPSDATRSAFRTAAIDVIREAGGASGLERPMLMAAVLPSLGLRASWSSTYVNHDGMSFRYVASVPWATLRVGLRRTNLSYVGVDLSLVDLVAPLSEFALRNNDRVEYKHSGRVAWNLITPRLDLLLAVPALSSHLAVGAGFSLRLVAPVEPTMRTENDATITTYDYQTVWGTDAPVVRFFEFGFFARYLI